MTHKIECLNLKSRNISYSRLFLCISFRAIFQNCQWVRFKCWRKMLRQRRNSDVTVNIRQRSFREIFARMVIEQAGKSREKHRCVRFIPTGMQRREETPREKSAENAPARKLVFFELNSLAIMDLVRGREKGYIPRWSKILVREIKATDLKTASLCFAKRATDKFVWGRAG